MRRFPPVLALALAGPIAAAQSHHPGPVVLLGERADPSLVPELAAPPEHSLLLVAGGELDADAIDARGWGGNETTAIVRLAPATEAQVDRAMLARVRSADLLALGPGSPKEWLDALLDRERATMVLNALHEAWSDGATLVGRGDSAALLSAAFAVRGAEELDWDVRNPRDDGGSRAARGLGYQPWAMIDTEARSSASLRRLVRSGCREGIELALYLPAGASVVADLTAARLRVHGAGGVVLVDTRRARRSRGAVRGARLTVLPAGGVWDAAERRVPLEPSPEPASEGRTAAPPSVEVEDLWGADLAALPEVGTTPWRRWIRDDGRRQLVLRRDESSRWGRIGAGGPGAHWLEGVACDLLAEDLEP